MSLDDSFGEHQTTRWRRENLPEVIPRHRFNSMYALSQAIAAGSGIGLLPSLYDPQQTHLQRISESIHELQMALWMLTHPDLRHQSRIRAFMEFYATIFADDPAAN